MPFLRAKPFSRKVPSFHLVHARLRRIAGTRGLKPRVDGLHAKSHRFSRTRSRHAKHLLLQWFGQLQKVRLADLFFTQDLIWVLLVAAHPDKPDNSPFPLHLRRAPSIGQHRGCSTRKRLLLEDQKDRVNNGARADIARGKYDELGGGNDVDGTRKVVPRRGWEVP